VRVVAGLRGLVGMRVIPFFAAKRLGCEQVGSHPLVMTASLVVPLAMALLAASVNLVVGGRRIAVPRPDPSGNPITVPRRAL